MFTSSVVAKTPVIVLTRKRNDFTRHGRGKVRYVSQRLRVSEPDKIISGVIIQKSR